MRPEDYPPQEPFTEIGARYHGEVMRRGAEIEGRQIRHGDNPYQSLVLYPAAEPNGSVLCVIHGGGWTNGYKEWMAFMAPPLNARGVTVVSLGYRLAPEHVFPAGFDDCCDGVAWVFDNVKDYGGDPRRIFVGGHSAGGHYAALMALGQQWQHSRQLPPEVIKGALPISGTYVFGADSGLSMRPRFLGPPDSGNEDAASAMLLIHPAAPAFLVAWGERDFPHLVAQSEAFSAALTAAGVSVETLQLDDCDHLGASYAAGDPGGRWIAAATRMLDNR